MRKKKDKPIDPDKLVPGSREEAYYYAQQEKKVIYGFNNPVFETSDKVGSCKECACFLEACIYGLFYNGKNCKTHRQRKEL